MKNILLITGVLIFSIFELKAQLEIGIVGSPSISTIIITDQKFSEQDLSGSYTYPFNYGFRIKYKEDKFLYSIGLLHLVHDRKYNLLKTTVIDPRGDLRFYDVFIKTRKIVVPLNVDYIFLERSKYSLFGGLGFYIGRLYFQEQEDTSYPKDWEPNPNHHYPFPVGRYTTLNQFEELYAGFNIGVGWRQKLTDHLSFQVRPNILYQLHLPIPYAFDNYRLISGALDLEVVYRIGNDLK